MTNLLFPARGDGTLVLGLPGPSVKEKKENKDKDMVFLKMTGAVHIVIVYKSNSSSSGLPAVQLGAGSSF